MGDKNPHKQKKKKKAVEKIVEPAAAEITAVKNTK